MRSFCTRFQYTRCLEIKYCTIISNFFTWVFFMQSNLKSLGLISFFKVMRRNLLISQIQSNSVTYFRRRRQYQKAGIYKMIKDEQSSSFTQPISKKSSVILLDQNFHKNLKKIIADVGYINFPKNI